MNNPIREAVQKLAGHWHHDGYTDYNNPEPNGCGLYWLDQVRLEDEDAIVTASGVTKYDVAENILRKTAAEQFPERAAVPGNKFCSFGFFNDHPDTTEDDVIAVMEKAAIAFDERFDL